MNPCIIHLIFKVTAAIFCVHTAASRPGRSHAVPTVSQAGEELIGRNAH